MFFSFDYRPFVAVIGDMKSSRRLDARRAVQAHLKEVLDTINRAYPEDLASSFMITLGDEFQGLLKTGASSIYIIDRIEREMYPVRLRFGLGVGKITTDIDSNMPLGADGPAYYNARRMIDELKASEKKKMESKTNVKIEVQDNAGPSELLNTLFALLTAVKETWTARQVEIINAYLQGGGTQKDAARVLNINQSNVQKSLATAHFYTYRKAVESVAKVLSEIKGDEGV